MSRIGKKPVKVPSALKVELSDRVLKLSSGSQWLSLDIHSTITLTHDAQASKITVSRNGDSRMARAMHGTTRAHVANMIIGLTKGFEKGIEIYGTGYGIKQEGTNLVLALGYAQLVTVPIPQGITVEIKTPNTRGNDTPAVFKIKGPDKCIVGQLAAVLRHAKPPEPYRGKGVRYGGEVIRRKAGKAIAAAG